MIEPRFKNGDRVIMFPNSDPTPGEVDAIHRTRDGRPYYTVKGDPSGDEHSVVERYMIREPAIDQLARVDTDD